MNRNAIASRFLNLLENFSQQKLDTFSNEELFWSVKRYPVVFAQSQDYTRSKIHERIRPFELRLIEKWLRSFEEPIESSEKLG